MGNNQLQTVPFYNQWNFGKRPFQPHFKSLVSFIFIERFFALFSEKTHFYEIYYQHFAS